MAGHTITVAKEIVAEPEQVWKVITNLEQAAKAITHIVSIERLEGSGYEVGTRWRETRRMLGKTATEEMWVSAIDPGKSTVISAESGGVEYTTTFRVKPSSLGTRLECEFSAHSEGAGLGQRLAWAVFGGVGAKATKRMLEQDLDDIAAWLR